MFVTNVCATNYTFRAAPFFLFGFAVLLFGAWVGRITTPPNFTLATVKSTTLLSFLL